MFLKLFLFGSLGRLQAETNRRGGQHRWNRGSVHNCHNGYRCPGRFSVVVKVAAARRHRDGKGPQAPVWCRRSPPAQSSHHHDGDGAGHGKDSRGAPFPDRAEQDGSIHAARRNIGAGSSNRRQDLLLGRVGEWVPEQAIASWLYSFHDFSENILWCGPQALERRNDTFSWRVAAGWPRLSLLERFIGQVRKYLSILILFFDNATNKPFYLQS